MNPKRILIGLILTALIFNGFSQADWEDPSIIERN